MKKTPNKIINDQTEEYNSYEKLLPNRYGVSHLLDGKYSTHL